MLSNCGTGGLLRAPWTARKSNQSILKKINPEYSLEGVLLRLKLQYFGHLMQRGNFLEKDLDPGKDWEQEEKRATENEMVGWHHWLSGHEFEQTWWDSERQGSLACCSPWGRKDSTPLSNWTELNWSLIFSLSKEFLIINWAQTLNKSQGKKQQSITKDLLSMSLELNRGTKKYIHTK